MRFFNAAADKWIAFLINHGVSLERQEKIAKCGLLGLFVFFVAARIIVSFI